MLKQRVVTAVLLAAALLAAVAYMPVEGLALTFGFIIALGGWEWSRLAGWQTSWWRLLYVVLVIATLVALYLFCAVERQWQREQVQPFLGLSCLWWSIALLWIKGYPGSAVLWRSRLMRGLMGLVTLAPAWLAAVYLLTFAHGSLLMIGLVVIVAAADIGAYFSGRRWGRHKLAPAVSPAKTWEACR